MGKARKALVHTVDHKVYFYLGDKQYSFPMGEYLFLQTLTHKDNNFDMTEAKKQTGISETDLKKLMAKKDTMDFISQRINERAEKHVWSEDHWYSELSKVWNGTKTVKKNQIEAIKELGSRIVPKVERVRHEFEVAEFELGLKE